MQREYVPLGSFIAYGRTYVQAQRGAKYDESDDWSERSGGLIIDLHIKVTYGTNIAAAVNSITHKITFTIEESVGIDVSKVNVYVDDMSC